MLGDTLRSEFSADEIEMVLAHELCHHANGRPSIFASAMAQLANQNLAEVDPEL